MFIQYAGHVLAVGRRGQQTVDHLLVGVAAVVLQNASTSASVGGRPVSVRLTRLISVSLSASGESCSPSRSRRLRTKRSMSLATRAADSHDRRRGFWPA